MVVMGHFRGAAAEASGCVQAGRDWANAWWRMGRCESYESSVESDADAAAKKGLLVYVLW